ncbi:MAG: GldG family protein [Treponema sp.]|jgi:ABC-type uncharacterized transport system involved in gliding motility auxiliary subunit|nr:GldG family protein [Treponema sp.]
MKKIITWLKSPASDFVLFIILIILANLVGSRAFKRFDLTAPKSYSLSPASRQLVKNIQEPLAVNVFFSSNLPAPYNATAQYVKDLLDEYAGTANKNFSCKFFDMDKTESSTTASGYGLRQIQIQQVANNEVGFKNVWMGIAVVYGDRIETLDNLTTSSGFEYKLTTTISKMIAATDTLAGLSKNDKIKLTLYVSDKLSDFDISGFDKLDSSVSAAFEAINKKNMNRIEYERQDPDEGTTPLLIQKYGIQGINWQDKDGSTGTAVLGLVLEYKDKFRLVPIALQRSLFGGYGIAGLDSLQDSISESLQSLVSRSTEIGYVTGHGEADLNDSRQGAGLFSNLVSDLYSFKKLDLSKDDIPSGLVSLIINGPKSKFSDSELYKIDQFIMKGGNVMFFIDPFNATGGNQYQQPQFTPIDTGLEKLLNKYGVKTDKNYVMDENCYTTIQQNYGKLDLMWAPLLQKRNLDQQSPVTKNLGNIIFLQNSSIDAAAAQKDKNVKVTILAKSSPKSWIQDKNINLNPMMIAPPAKEEESSHDLAVLLEGKFNSAFNSEPASTNKTDSTLTMQSHIAKSTQPGKIFVIGSSAVTSAQLIDQDGKEPISLFIRNVVDYMNGASEFCTMRTKGLSVDTLYAKNGPAVAAATYFNEYGIPLIIVIAGLIAWKLHSNRRRRIHEFYNPNDDRDGMYKKTGIISNTDSEEGKK